ncbi:lipopolysaccharide biosynthesis protein [Acuticoccus sp.]|uniref:lipopolysaccharide biosynthesis protein n=1 Tax=Acuticoccus sp. TaxID=1904378 RepID=UPI003B5246B9
MARRGLPEDDTSDLGAKAARGGLIGVGAQLVAMALQLANVAVMSRLLAPQDFGLVAMAATIVAFIELFRELGLTIATIQRDRIDQDTVSGLFAINLGVGILLMAVAMGVSPLAAAVFGDERVATLIVAISLTLPVAAAGAQQEALLNRQMRWLTLRWTGLTAQALGILVGIAAAVAGAGTWALVANSWTMVLASTVLIWMVSSWRPSWVRDWSGALSTLGFGLALTGFNLMQYMERQFDNALIGWRWGATELGFYSRAYGLLLLPQSVVMGPLTVAVLPALSRLQNRPQEWASLILQWLRLTSLFTFCAAAVVIANASDVTRIVLGAQWGEAAVILSLLGWSMIARAFVAANVWVFISLGTTRRMFAWHLATLPAYLIAYFVGVEYGAEGVAVGFAVAFCATALPSIAFAVRGTSLSTWAVVRACLPLAGLAVALIVAAPLWRLELVGDELDVVRGLVNIVVTGGLYAFGASVVVALDPTYDARAILRRLRASLPARRGTSAPLPVGTASPQDVAPVSPRTVDPPAVPGTLPADARP